jgi:hypothetical protein
MTAPTSLVTMQHDPATPARIRDAGLKELQPVPDGPIKAHHYFTAVDHNVAVRKKVKKGIAAYFKPLRDALNTVKAGLIEVESGLVDPLDELNRADERRMLDWRDLQTRLAREEEARLRAIAEEKARAETERLRLEAEAEAEEAALMAAAAAEAAGDTATAAAIEAAPIEVTVEPVAPRPVSRHEPILVKRAGTAFVDHWSAEVTDLGALVAFVAGHPEFGKYVMANLVELNIRARAGGPVGEEPPPGVRFVNKPGVSSR